MIKILIIEDDETIAFGVKAYLTKKNYEVTHGKNLREGRELFTEDIDLVLLDLNLPDGSGFDFCGHIKTIRDVPVIFLTVRDDHHDIVRGLDMGGDDYITKPFKLSVLQSRITAVLRRANKQIEDVVLSCKNIKLVKSEGRVYKNNSEVEITVGEYNLLLQLLENKNCTLTRDILLEKLWDVHGEFVNNNTLSVAIKRLRKKLGEDSIIKTVRGIGYRIDE